MSFSPVPDYKFDTLTEISPNSFQSLGVTLVMLDLDNTIAPYDEHMPSGKMQRWTEEMKRAGIDLYIISNSRKSGRVSAFSNALGIPYVNRARKPSPRALRDVMREQKISPQNAAMIGDQTYTDVLAGNRAGVLSIVVSPIKFTNPFLAVRYVLELPFRSAGRKYR